MADDTGSVEPDPPQPYVEEMPDGSVGGPPIPFTDGPAAPPAAGPPTAPEGHDPLESALRGPQAGCVEAFLFFIFLMLFGVAGFIGSSGKLVTVGEPPPELAGLGEVPGLQVSGNVTTTTTTVAPTTTTEAPAPSTTAPAVVTTVHQQPPPTTAPPPPPPPACSLPSSIGVSGGSVTSLPGSGGSFTVQSIPVTLTATMPHCAQHYRLEYSGSGTSGTYSGSDCKMDAFNVSISNGSMAVGDTINVTLQLPPNACG